MCLVHPGRGVQIYAQHTRAGSPSSVLHSLQRGMDGADLLGKVAASASARLQRLVRLCRSGLLFVPAAPVTEILLPLGSELWIHPFTPVSSTDSIG